MKSVENLAQELHSYNNKDEVKYKYKIGDLVYSLWKGQLWKAVILDTSLKIHPNGWHPIYYVGYVKNHKNGSKNYYFNKIYNEWKSEALIFEIDGNTRKKSFETQKMLRNALKEQNQAIVEEILGELNSQQEIKISILNFNKIEVEWFDFSEMIYSVLIHDKNQINHGKLVILPKNPSIEDIFVEYITYQSNLEKKKKQISPEIEIQKAILSMLTKIFNKALKKRLIYPSEMNQVSYFEKKTTKSTQFSEIFGIEHFLRLLIILPRLIGDNISFGDYSFSLDPDEENDHPDYLIIKAIKLELVKTVNSFIDYFNNNFSKFSIGNYKPFSI
ncbi:MRG Alp3 like i with a chromodomain and an MRG domain [Cryptosporidium sp. chipmunk genotype I]|uniref:MRG Alp3 like i with a chromodomain and an MRG domain n=1 Tax=Cryptosporidium sp. chipmunk genotype I TaxID=1280935 RepID=UPI003519F26B|nr:MRG Alp3 like i with a chromodomain and an MRG domain [Cryptosporidium sp. chipmunk genotype I]